MAPSARNSPSSGMTFTSAEARMEVRQILHLLSPCLGHGYDDLVYAVLGDESFEVLDHPEDRSALDVPANLRGRRTDETHDLRLGRRRAPDMPGERHTSLSRPHDGRPRPASDL